MRFGFIGSCPLHLVPLFIFFRLRASLLSPFLSCLPVFMSCHLIPSFACARSGPGLSMYARNRIHFKARFQVAQVLTMKRDSSFVAVRIGFPLIATTYIRSVLSPCHVVICLSVLRARVHSSRNLNFSRLP